MQTTRCMNCRRNDEMVDTLIAISVVSKRLARKLALLGDPSLRDEMMKGESHDEQDERSGHGHYRVAQVR
ncbi:MAG: hypothetical protein PHI27_05810 [Eubacteriales bacterium]|nr:hypothetical protein [Eubacteriales bacterium]